MQILAEAFLTGIMLLILGLVIAYIINLLKCGNHPYSNWAWLGFLLFVTGFVGHLLAEYTGMNTKYCQQGHACVMLKQ